MKHHLCIHDEYSTFDGEFLPMGKNLVGKELTSAINEILDTVIHKIVDSDVIICGEGDVKRMVGRKLEDRLKRKISYE